MNGTWIHTKREELYKKVWAAPMKTVAQELGISSSSLASVVTLKPANGGHLKTGQRR